MKEKHFDAHGLSLSARVWGEKPNIIILHGWLDQAGSWDPVCSELLSHGLSSIVYDHRGHGKSDHAPKNTHYHFPDYVSDLACIHRHITPTHKPVIIIGHSMGGTIATLYASMFPERIQHLILIEGLGPRYESAQQAKNRYKKHLMQRQSPQNHLPFSSVDEAAQRLKKHHPSLSNKRAHKLASRILIPHKQGWIWRFDPRHKERSAISFSQERHEVILSTIDTPCSFIFGKKSPYLRWIDVEKRSKLIPTHRQTYYIDGGHSPHISHPDVLSRILIQDCIQG